MASKQRGDVAQMKGALKFFFKTHKLLKGFLKKLKVGENLQNTFNTYMIANRNKKLCGSC